MPRIPEFGNGFWSQFTVILAIEAHYGPVSLFFSAWNGSGGPADAGSNDLRGTT
jgi:hypothetical protein